MHTREDVLERLIDVTVNLPPRRLVRRVADEQVPCRVPPREPRTRCHSLSSKLNAKAASIKASSLASGAGILGITFSMKNLALQCVDFVAPLVLFLRCLDRGKDVTKENVAGVLVHDGIVLPLEHHLGICEAEVVGVWGWRGGWWEGRGREEGGRGVS